MVVRAVTGASGSGGGVLPNLPSASSVNSTDLIAVYQSPTLRQATALQFAQFVATVIAGEQMAATLGSGSTNDYNPTGFGPTINRLDIDPNAGNSTLTGLQAYTDNQIVIIRNTDAVNSLTLSNQDAGSLAANRFAGPDSITLTPGGSIWVVYYAGTVNNWIMTP